MLKHYLSSAVRGMRSGRLYAAINLFGLAAGLGAALVLGQIIRSELGYDTFHPDADRLVRIGWTDPGADVSAAMVSPAFGPALLETLPEVASFARVTPVGPLLSNNDVHIAPERTFWADPSVLDVFGFEWLAGTPDLSGPDRIVLSESTAQRLFGDTHAVGKTVLLNEEDPVTVTGVFRDTPAKSHIHFDAIVSISILEKWFNRSIDTIWDSPNYATYVRLAPGVSEAQFTDALQSFVGRQVPDGMRDGTLFAMAVTDIHLHSTVVGELEPAGSTSTLWMLGAICVLILFVAGANYVNLVTSRLDRRRREAGLRKAVGARPGQLMTQYWVESVVTALGAAVLGAVMAWSLLPVVAEWSGRAHTIPAPSLPGLLLFGSVIGILLGSLAGLFPALVLSRLRPGVSLRGGTSSRPGHHVQQALVVTQFCLAVIIVTATLVVKQQLDFVQSADLGFTPDGVVSMPGIRSLAADFEPFRERLLEHPDIVAVSHAWRPPGSALLFTAEASVEGRDATVYPFFADPWYAETVRLEMAAGTMYRANMASEMESGLVINEAAVRAFGFDSPEAAVGASINYAGRDATIVGVARDYHQESLRAEIAPMVILPYAQNYRTVLVRYTTRDAAALADFLVEQWKPYEGNYPVTPHFLDDDLDALYQKEQRLAGTFGAFAVLGILVSCLGLLGMATASTQRRRREIGIRKALGASVSNVTGHMLRDYLYLAILSLALGLPVALVASRMWLQSFAYHTTTGWLIPLLAGALSLGAALLAVGFEAIRAGRTNPVDALRSE